MENGTKNGPGSFLTNFSKNNSQESKVVYNRINSELASDLLSTERSNDASLSLQTKTDRTNITEYNFITDKNTNLSWSGDNIEVVQADDSAETLTTVDADEEIDLMTTSKNTSAVLSASFSEIVSNISPEKISGNKCYKCGLHRLE